jgi:hypothetical protein
VEATGQFYFPVDWLPPGHDPGAGGGVALLPGSGPFGAWYILERSRDHRVARDIVSSDTTDSVASRASVVTRAEESDRKNRNFGRTSERFVSERRPRVKRKRFQALGPKTARETTCHGGYGRHSAGYVQRRVTAPGHGCHGAGHGFHGASHSDHGDGEQPAGPDSAAA